MSSSETPKRHQLLLPGVSPYEVDFVIPRIGMDVPVGIDPFLLFKSRDPVFIELHRTILDAFSAGVRLLKEGKSEQVRKLFQFPEPPEIGLGYTEKSKRGSGLGTFLTDLIIETISNSPLILERGVKHIEELQLFSLGIGPDRVSDITACLLKQFLIKYTQRQAAIWNLQLKASVPINHLFNKENLSWESGYFDLPISPVDGAAILLVPRRIVRSLPWINFEDFVKLEFAPYLRAQAVKNKGATSNLKIEKKRVVEVTRSEFDRVVKYITTKEKTASQAQPTQEFLSDDGISAASSALIDKLHAIPIGTVNAALYQQTVLEILNFLFEPELIDGQLEVRTIDGTERRDIIFTNDSDQTFWSYIRNEHSSLFLMFEIKNMDSLTNDALNQTGTYLGERLGRLGFIVTRNQPAEAQTRKAFSIYNDSYPKKVVLFLSDHDLCQMINQKSSGKDPMRYVQNLYRAFRTTVQ